MARMGFAAQALWCVREVQGQLRARFSAEDQHPVGGLLPEERVQFRTGSQIVLDGFPDEYGAPDEECGLVWVTTVRKFRSRDFPGEHMGVDNCGAPLAVQVQVGVARCSIHYGDDLGPADPERVEWEGVRGLDDAERLDRALCAAGTALDERGLIAGYVLDAAEPLGPEGGVITWIQHATFFLA